jgi:hypothetical protein
MANNQGLTAQQATIDYYKQYGYPAAAKVFAIGDGDMTWHLIIHTAAPSTNFNNAPLGSMFIYTGGGAGSSVLTHGAAGSSTWNAA